MSPIRELTGAMGLVPLAVVAWAHHDRPREVRWWILASAFAVSWITDTLAHVVNPWFMSLVYPVSQCWLIGKALLEQALARVFLAALIAAGVLAAAVNRASGPDVILHSVAWLGVCAIAWRQTGLLRWSLLATFGFGWIAWLGYVLGPGWTTWGIYQATRALGIGLFCWAATDPRPAIRLA